MPELIMTLDADWTLVVVVTILCCMRNRNCNPVTYNGPLENRYRER
jgi:hypothetical protein